MCAEIENGEGRYCDAVNTFDDFERFGNDQIHALIGWVYKPEMVNPSECHEEVYSLLA